MSTIVKLGRPRMGTQRRVILTASVDPNTLKRFVQLANLLPKKQRRLGVVLDQIAARY
jgi:hypothetical protein